jgi:hypothetical protein
MPTAIQPVVIEGPGGGLITHVDPRHVPEKAWANGRNIRFPASGTYVKKTDGYAKIDVVAPFGQGTEHGTEQTQIEPIRALWDYKSPVAPRHRLVQITLTGAWHGLGSDRENFNDINAPAATLDNVVTIDQYKEKLIWADGLRVLQWDGFLLASTLGPQSVPEEQRAPTAKIVEIHKSHVLLANITAPKSQPWRVHWSAPDNPNKWAPENDQDSEGDLAGHIDFLEDASDITAVKILGDHAIVHKPNRVYRMVFEGEPNMYRKELIPADDGAISARSPISIGSFQYFMGRRNFYRLAAYTEPIGDAIWPEIDRTLDWARAGQIYAYRRQEFDEICWKMPQVGGAPDLTAAYNFRAQTWSLTNHDPGTCFAEITTELLTFPPSPIPVVRGVFGQLNGAIQVYGGPNADAAPIHAWLESRHFTSTLLPSKILAVPVFATGNGFLTVRLRAAMEARHPLPPWTPALNVHPSAIYVLPPAPGAVPSRPDLPASETRPWLDVRAYGRIWQIRVESGELGDDWRLDAYGVAMIPGDYAR